MTADTWKKLWGIRLAKRAAMVNDAAEVLRLDREVANAHHRQHLGEQFQNDSEDDDMIHVGDNNYTQPAKAVGTSKLAKAALITALALGTGGAGAGLASLLMDPPTFTDTDTRYELRLVPEVEK